MTSRIPLRQVLSNLTVPEADIREYIVSTADPVTEHVQNVSENDLVCQEEQVSHKNFLNFFR